MALINIDILRQLRGNVKVDTYRGVSTSRLCGAVPRSASTAEVTTDRSNLVVNGSYIPLRVCKTGHPIEMFTERQNDDEGNA